MTLRFWLAVILDLLPLLLFWEVTIASKEAKRNSTKKQGRGKSNFGRPIYYDLNPQNGAVFAAVDIAAQSLLFFFFFVFIRRLSPINLAPVLIITF